jgi:N-acyl-D-amino-acid deacylase
VEFDLVIRNGTVIDGTGRPRFRADLGIRDGRIAAIAAGVPLRGGEDLDAEGLIVAPGFIDIHSHLDWMLPRPDHDCVQAPIVLQGITTAVTGNCGLSPAPLTDISESLVRNASWATGLDSMRWRSVGEYLATLEQQGILLNVAFLVGHATLRYAVMGLRAYRSDSTGEEIAAMAKCVYQAMDEGALGLSTGLGYVPGRFASSDELLALLQVVAQGGGFYATHMRSYRVVSPVYRPTIIGEAHNVLATKEQLELARRSGVRLQISHLIFHGRRTWGTYPQVLNEIESAVANGLDVAFDAYTQTFGVCPVTVNLPDWFLESFSININDDRALEIVEKEIALLFHEMGRGYGDMVLISVDAPELAPLVGRDFLIIADSLGMSPFEAYAHVARVSEGKAGVLQFTYSAEARGEYDEPLRAVLSHPLCAFETDNTVSPPGEFGVNPGPGAYGTFPRILGLYCRDLGLFSLEEAIHRMTGFSAKRIGLDGEIGRIATGLWADLVVFDPKTVADNTTSKRPNALPTGIRAVLISGHVVAKDGAMAGHARCGRVLRR